MKKVLTCLAFLLLFISLALFYSPNPVRAVSCDQNCGSGTGFCGCSVQPTVTCDDAACTKNCITSCSTANNCTVGDGTKKGDDYCSQFGASCPASSSTRQFFDTKVTCDTDSGNCKSDCPYFSCSVDTATATGATTGTAIVKFTGTAIDGYDRIDWFVTGNSAGTNNPDASGNGSVSLTSLTADTSYKVTAVYWTSDLSSPAISCSGSPSFLTYPSAPTSLSASCPAPGTTGTVSWTNSSGATSHNVRINNTSNGWSNNCSSLNSGDFCFG